MTIFNKIICFLCLVLFSQSNIYAETSYSGWRTIHAEYSDWSIATSRVVDGYILKNDVSDMQGIGIVCIGNWTSLSLYKQISNTHYDVMNIKEKSRLDKFNIEIDDSNIVLNGRVEFMFKNIMLFSDHAVYDKYHNETNKVFIKLFEYMLNAKKSLSISAKDSDDNSHTITFSAKGLPEALIDFAERCGPQFQTFSGLDIKTQKEEEK